MVADSDSNIFHFKFILSFWEVHLVVLNSADGDEGRYFALETLTNEFQRVNQLVIIL